MIPTKARPILIIAASLLATVAAIGFYQFNKGPVDVRTASAKKVDAVSLYQAFTLDSIKAQKKFNGKVLEVEGKVEKLGTNQENEQLLLLKTNEDGAFINCTLENKDVKVTIGETVSVKGICNGVGEAEPDLGIKADLYLTRGYLKR